MEITKGCLCVSHRHYLLTKGCFVKIKQPFVRMKQPFGKMEQPFISGKQNKAVTI
ncbi:MAG: hypothetical protein LBL74_07235 [Bacteroidales bacterium]|nr:hypothetical protein [Bacteroidales bacterium]